MGIQPTRHERVPKIILAVLVGLDIGPFEIGASATAVCLLGMRDPYRGAHTDCLPSEHWRRDPSLSVGTEMRVECNFLALSFILRVPLCSFGN